MGSIVFIYVCLLKLIIAGSCIFPSGKQGPKVNEHGTLLFYKEKIQRKIDAKLPYIWRLVINDQQIFEVCDRSRGKVLIEMCNFTDFPLTDYDGSFTPVFMSFIDDWLVFNTPIICVQESLADTAFRVSLYDAFMLKMPAFSQVSDK
ncbi:MAG: hypothetical protein ABH827_04460 [bacterium]